MFELVIKNGFLIDGSGSDGYTCDIGINDGKIAKIAQNLTGIECIDADGLTVSPGFIDSHSHSDNSILSFPDQIEKCEQGITVSMGGQCGMSLVPKNISGKIYDGFGKSEDILTDFGSFFKVTGNHRFGSGLAPFAGHSNIRNLAMGLDNRKPTSDEMKKMKELLSDAFEKGAFGLSFGLIYPTSCFADTDELIELAKVAAKYDRIVSVHLRNEGDNFIESVNEFLTILRKSGARGVFSHHKACYVQNHGKVKESLSMIDKANEDGMDVYLDVYPYIASHTSLAARLIPKEYFSGGNDELAARLNDKNIRRSITEHIIKNFGEDDDLIWILLTNCGYEGKTLKEVADIQGKSVYDAGMDIIRDTLNSAQACYFMMCEDDVETVISHPRCMIGTDASVAGNLSAYHPRLRATFPRALARYVREKNTVTLPEMVRKITSLPAHVYGIENKGCLKEGYDADICIFDAKNIIDHADFVNFQKRSEGMKYVIIGGKIAVKDGIYTGVKNATILQKQQI